ncbi:hypothetical protein J6590_067466 [Homalodisca vitripennis]|nr:hypothetical protein J6590_067466 [Homalodisca vitripennis]
MRASLIAASLYSPVLIQSFWAYSFHRGWWAQRRGRWESRALSYSVRLRLQ